MRDHAVDLRNGSEIRLYEDGSVLIIEATTRKDRVRTVCLDGEESIAAARAILKHFGEGVE